MFKVLVADKLSHQGIEVLQSDPLIELHIKIKMPKEELIEFISDFDAILVRSQTKITAEVIKHAKKLKVIGRAGIGLDNIDVEAAKSAGIRILNVCNESSISVAEHTIGMILALARHIPQAHKSTKDRLWEREKYMGVEIYKKVLGVVGFGRIGYEVALRAKALGMHVIAFDPYCPPERAAQLSITLVPLKELLPVADFITLHIPKNDETIDLISYPELCLCKKGVRIINMSRGGILNEAGLVQALQEGIVGGAGLDVFDNEPNINEALLEFAQVVTTPHIGASTEDAQIKIAVVLAQDVLSSLHEIESLPLKSQKSAHSPFANAKQPE